MSPAADLLRYERRLWRRGMVRVCGIDEAGRGPLAGPVVAAAVILPRGFHLRGLTDSKQLTLHQRESFYEHLTAAPGVRWGFSMVDATEIDRTDILRATWKAMVQARAALRSPPDWTLVDGLFVPPLGRKQTAIVKGDSLSLSIAAASVIAKVVRDRWMDEMDCRHAGYGFARHKGYGTALHLKALRKLGPSPIHRRTFEPVRLAALSRIG